MQVVEVVKWGNSNAVRLPAAVMRQIHIAQGDSLILKTTDGKIVLEPAAKEYQLDDLLAQITDENQHKLVDFGAPVGREIW